MDGSGNVSYKPLVSGIVNIDIPKLNVCKFGGHKSFAAGSLKPLLILYYFEQLPK